MLEGTEQTGTAGKEVGVELTQRQKDLLEYLGLPTEYDELTDSQKNAVTSIEDMLTYLEDKYEKSFSYLSYAAAGVLEEEHLEAYPSQGDLTAQYFPGDSLKIYSEIKAADEDAENLLQNVSAVTYIFLNQSVCEEGYDAFAGASLQWLEENCRGTAAGDFYSREGQIPRPLGVDFSADQPAFFALYSSPHVFSESRIG